MFHICFWTYGLICENKARGRPFVRAARHHRYSSFLRNFLNYVCEYSPEVQCVPNHGVSQGKEQLNDLRPTRQSKVQVWQSAFLGQRVFRRYGRKEQKTNSGVHPKSVNIRSNSRPDQYKRVCGPVYGSREPEGIRKAP